jgi:hypothetical protein
MSVCISAALAGGEISYWWLLWQFVEKIQIWLKSVQNIRPCIWRTKIFFSRRWQRHMWHNDGQNTLLLCYDNAFNIYYIADRYVACQKYKQDVLLRFHADDSYAKAPRCYITLYCLSCYSLRSILILSFDLLLCLPRGDFSSGFHHAFLCVLPHARPIVSFWFAHPINIS